MKSQSCVTGEKGEKLAKFLARCGVASRRKCEEVIRAGWVRIDGEIVQTPETRIVPRTCVVQVRGKRVQPLQTHRYIILNKPEGILCTCKPGRETGPTILDIVKVPERIYPVGRLDKNTSGLVLLTNDGELAQHLTHPSFEKEKEYLVETIKPMKDDVIGKLLEGVPLEDGISRFKNVKRAGPKNLKVVLTEGRKRQIRRTFKELNMRIKTLHRIRLGNLTLSDLPSGNWRDLKPEETRLLKLHVNHE